MLTMREYQRLAQRTSPNDGHDKIDNGLLGLIGETGEVVDVYKKWMYQSEINTPLPDKKLADELGDILWYIAELAEGMDDTMYGIIGKDFREIDDDMKKKSARRTALRNVIVGMAGRASALNKAVCRNEWRSTYAHMRRLMIAVAHLGHRIGYPLEKIAEMNIDKLKKRYPDGFDARKSMERYE